jgi:hypothetical protein
MGLHTGEPSVSRGASGGDGSGADEVVKLRPQYVGIDVHRAARIASAGFGGQVLLSETTRDLVYQDLPDGINLIDLGFHQLKDIRHPQHIYQLNIQGLPDEFPALKTESVASERGTHVDQALAVPTSQAEVDAYRSLIKRWRNQGLQTLDKVSLAMLLGAPVGISIDRDDLILLLRSALKAGVALDSWVGWAKSTSEAVGALEALYKEYPRPESRLILVESLCQIPDPQATQVLLQIAGSDDAHKVRVRAALDAASRGQHEQVVKELSRQAREGNDPAAIAALVAVIDTYGLPEGSWDYPKLPVATGLFQRRWASGRETVWRRSNRGALGGALAMGLLGIALPLLALLSNPAAFKQNLEFFSIGAWSLSGLIVGMVWGGLQGLASGFAVSCADLLTSGRHATSLRFIAGGIAGVVFSILMILFATTGLIGTTTGPAVYILVFFLYGFLQGGALSRVIPKPGEQHSFRRAMIKALQTALFIGVVALPAIYLVYHEKSLSRLPLDWLYAILMSSGLALATRKG